MKTFSSFGMIQFEQNLEPILTKYLMEYVKNVETLRIKLVIHV